MTLPIVSHGPEKFRGGPRCPDHHEGVRTGYPDWCCCCDPCLYIRPRPNEVGGPFDVSAYSCRCVPMLICATFTPDPGSDPCAKVIQSVAFPTFSEDIVPGTVSYDFGFDIQVTVLSSVWRFFSDSHSIDQSYDIDHVNITCLQFPEVSITGIVIGTVTGTVTFSEFASSKIPFSNRQATDESERDTYPVSNTDCSCYSAAGKLCVNGRRHVNGPIEQVEFLWNEDLQDRWEYLPPCGDPTLHSEVIYLRGDDDGNCYLEFDFEQTGATTNDWANPPTSDGDTAKMTAITTCTCELFVQSSSTGSRFVTITGGRCAEYQYICGSCRCVPTYLCVFGEIDGTFINSRATWYYDTGNDYGWLLEDSPDILIKIKGACTVNADGITIYSTDPVKPCVLFARELSGDQAALTEDSDPISCGFELSANMEVRTDANPLIDRENWLWVSSSICGSCATTTCGMCPDQCGSNPLVLYYFLRCIDNGPDDPEDPDFGIQTFCDLTVEVHYWQRWDETTRGIPKCGYLGYSAPITCGEDIYRIRVYADDFGLNPTIERAYLSGPVFDKYGPTGDWTGDPTLTVVGEALENPMKRLQNGDNLTMGTLSCDPVLWEGSGTAGIWCPWCCATHMDTFEVTVYE